MGRYDQLREDRLCAELQKAHPDWPYPLLFHGEEISRDVFLLDPVVEYRVLKLGRNVVQDAEYLAYPFLNEWFHYRFFNGICGVMRSSQSAALLPRLFRLHRALLEAQLKRTVVDRAQQPVEDAPAASSAPPTCRWMTPWATRAGV